MDSQQLFDAEEQIIRKEISQISSTRKLSEWANKYGLSTHRLVVSRRHQLEKRFQCQQCTETFKHHRDLRTHQTLQHQNVMDDDDDDDEILLAAEEEIVRNAVSTMTTIDEVERWAKHYGYGESTAVIARRQALRRYSCTQCDKSYAHKQHLNRHMLTQHVGVTFSCGTCKKDFASKQKMLLHEKKCGKVQLYECSQCTKKFTSPVRLRQHMQTHNMTEAKGDEAKKPRHTAPTRKNNTRQVAAGGEERAGPSRPFSCRRCPERFESRRQLYQHGMRAHYQRGGGQLQARPWTEDQAPWIEADGSVNQGLKSAYETNSPLILERQQEGPVESRYNLPVNHRAGIDDIMDGIDEIYQRQRYAFKVNLSFGFILRHIETGEYRYFIPYSNTDFLDQPFVIKNRLDLTRLRQKLKTMSVMDHFLSNRPNTKWRLALLTNIVFRVYTTSFPIGNAQTVLPDYISNHRFINSLVREYRTKKVYTDNLCVFRCLALHSGFTPANLTMETQRLFSQWRLYSEQHELKTVNGQNEFEGVSLTQLPGIETCFQVNISAYDLREDGSAFSVYQTRNRYPGTTMYVNLHEKHFSYITDIDQYCSRYQCKTCERFFPVNKYLKKHQNSCTGQTKFKFPGGYYQASKSVFEELEDVDVFVKQDNRVYPWFIVFDFESVLETVNEVATDKLTWTQKHVPISVSVCSNVPGFLQPKCFINTTLKDLLSEMIEYMTSIQEVAHGLAGMRWGEAERGLKEELEKWTGDGEDEDKAATMMRERVSRCMGKFMAYMKQIPVLGFNSARYDLPLIMEWLGSNLDLPSDEFGFVIKQNNAYSCISTEKFKFLDVSNFLSPGTSYAAFLKAYRVAENKGFFPYEYFDSVDKLDVTELPPQDSFYSSLKDSHISDADYQFCQAVWTDKNMTTFRDFLIWYNNLDVEPFVEAVTKMQQFYFQRQIDLFKVSVSVPGIARKLLFQAGKETGSHFALVDEKNKDLFHTIKNNIVGGPSIIFHRYHKAEETYIRNNEEKMCKKIIGFDANALYLWSMDQDMPSETFIRRKAENGFKPEVRDHFLSAFHWMDHLNVTGQYSISHKMNNGREKRIGPYPVDGWDAGKRVVFQFHGCYWHGHDCILTRDVKNGTWRQERQAKYQRTLNTTQYIRDQGYPVIEMWECQYRQYCKDHPSIWSIINKARPTFYRSHRGTVTETQILNGVVSGRLFGMVEVDISVPEHWTDEIRTRMSLPPHQYFEEMSPLFCTVDVPFDAIGDHMRDHVIQQNLSQKPRRLLVGGMKAERILLATPLLQWYLDHGMVVTKVYQVVEFVPKPSFRNFVSLVTNARREGDVNPDLSVLSDTYKLIGNSAFGGSIMDKTKHRTVKCVRGESNACLQVNLPTFRKLKCLNAEEEFYEAEMAKSIINMDLPIQIGYFILQYAKLRMLQFYYDFLDVYLARRDFQMLEMDTDSCYAAYSADSLDKLIKPDMRTQYDRCLRGFCKQDDVTADTHYHWFPRTCCSFHAKRDKRTPGLFKTEFVGNEMTSLCSKTYLVVNHRPVSVSTVTTAARLLKRALGKRASGVVKRKLDPIRHIKFSSKGVNKRLVKYPRTIFARVLRTQAPATSLNKGFRCHKNTIFTYAQEKTGFSYLYCKRKVLADGITTVPLDIVLTPGKPEVVETGVPDQPEEEVSDETLVGILQEMMEA